MNVEKHSDGGEPIPEEDTPSSRKKPVVVYIMILFIVAFLLMALSFLMHQRSNTEALGELQHSVSAMQEVQAIQDKIIQLQEELADAQDTVDALQDQAEADALARQALQDQADALQDQAAALTALYCLQQSYSARDFDVCRELIQTMESQGYPALLPDQVSGGEITPPSQRYLQLKEAIESR